MRLMLWPRRFAPAFICANLRIINHRVHRVSQRQEKSYEKFITRRREGTQRREALIRKSADLPRLCPLITMSKRKGRSLQTSRKTRTKGSRRKALLTKRPSLFLLSIVTKLSLQSATGSLQTATSRLRVLRVFACKNSENSSRKDAKLCLQYAHHSSCFLWLQSSACKVPPVVYKRQLRVFAFFASLRENSSKNSS